MGPRPHLFLFSLLPQTINQFKKLHLTSRTLQIPKNKLTSSPKIVGQCKGNEGEFDMSIWRNSSSRLKHWIFQRTPMTKLDYFIFSILLPLPYFSTFFNFSQRSIKHQHMAPSTKCHFLWKMLLFFYFNFLYIKELCFLGDWRHWGSL